MYTPGPFYGVESFYINRAVAVYGGFVGTETHIEERVPGAHPTILSGDIDHDDFSVNGVDEDTDAIVGNNSRHVVYIDGTSTGGGVTESTIIDGFIITGGDAAFSDGGGLFCNGSGSGGSGECSPTIANITFIGNRSDQWGGAMLNTGAAGGASSPSLTNITFSGNKAGLSGGAIYNDGRTGISSPVLTNVTFSVNEADETGGAMYNDGRGGGSSPRLTNVTFSGNEAGDSGGAMYNNGLGGNSSPDLADVTFSGNVASHYGGAIFDNAGSFDDQYGYSHPRFTNVILWGDSVTAASSAGDEIFIATNGSGFVGSLPTIDFSILQGGDASVVSDNGSTPTVFSHGANNLDANPLLGILAENGGTTKTLLPGAGSPSIDHGTCHGAPVFDQRGLGRSQGPRCDIGAVENELVRPNNRCYVDAYAIGANDGSSWGAAYIDLKSAIRDASCNNIWVANGVYKPGASTTNTFMVKPDTKVYGGFAGGETSLAQRNPATNLTVLSGDIDNNDTGANGVDALVANIVGSNSSHVITLDGTTTGTPITASTVLDGFTVTGGDARSADLSAGGGLLCEGSGMGHECSPTLNHLVFSGNAAQDGGAIYSEAAENGTSNPTLTNVSFNSNTAEYGGAMYNNAASGGASSPILINVTFSANSAAGGGAMFNDGSDGGVSNPTLTNVTFSGNFVVGYPLMTTSGGAIFNYADAGTSSPSLTNVTFSDNSAEKGGRYTAAAAMAAPLVRHC